MLQHARETSSADGIAWDLKDLYGGVDDPQINRDLEDALRRAQAFEGAYRGKIDLEGGPEPALLLAALTELEGLAEQMDRPSVYAGLLHAAKTDDARRGALLAHTREQWTAINKHLIFFDLEWVRVPDDASGRLLAAPELARYRHYLERKRAWRPHYLSEPEEKLLEEKAVTGRAAFVRLFDEACSALRCPFEHDGHAESLSMQQILAKLYDADRGVRRAAAAGLTKGLQENARLLTYIFNIVVLDHKSDCACDTSPARWNRATWPTRSADEVVECPDDRGRAAPRDGAPLLPAQGPVVADRRRCTTTIATRPSSPTSRAATGRPPGGSSRRATDGSAPGPATSSASSSTRTGSTPSCGRASAAGPSAAARCPVSIPTS